MRIMVVYPGAGHSTYDVATGIHKALEKTDNEIGFFPYHHYIKFYQNALEKNPSADAASVCMWAGTRVAINIVEFVPDVVLIIAGGSLHRRAYELINRLSIPIVLLLTESPYIDATQAIIMQCAKVKAALTNERLSAPRLQTDTGIKTVYLPHSIDPDKHYPHAKNLGRSREVFFHGTLWPEREELFDGLDHAHITGYRVDGTPYNTSGTGIIENAELAKWYSNAKIALNHHRTNCEYDELPPADSLGPRAYEISACGAFQLCDNTRSELREVFGDSVATYVNRVDLEDQIKYYLKRDATRQEMAREALQRVQGCTFDRRVNNILLPLLTEVRDG